MFRDFLDKAFTVTRSTTIKGTGNNIASLVTQNYGPYPCRLAMTSKSNSNLTQTQPQNVSTQSFRLYTVIDANVKNGDIAIIEGVKYIVSNVYKPNNHHLEVDMSFKEEV